MARTRGGPGGGAAHQHHHAMDQGVHLLLEVHTEGESVGVENKNDSVHIHD